MNKVNLRNVSQMLILATLVLLGNSQTTSSFGHEIYRDEGNITVDGEKAGFVEVKKDGQVQIQVRGDSRLDASPCDLWLQIADIPALERVLAKYYEWYKTAKENRMGAVEKEIATIGESNPNERFKPQTYVFIFKITEAGDALLVAKETKMPVNFSDELTPADVSKLATLMKLYRVALQEHEKIVGQMRGNSDLLK